MEFACKNETSSNPARRRRRGNPAFWSRRCYLAAGGTGEPLGDYSSLLSSAASLFSPFPRQGELYKTRERLILSCAAGNGRCSPLSLVIFDLLASPRLSSRATPVLAPIRRIDAMAGRKLDKQSRRCSPRLSSFAPRVRLRGRLERKGRSEDRNAEPSILTS